MTEAPHSNDRDRALFITFARDVQMRVEQELRAFLETEARAVRFDGRPVANMLEVIADVCLRGGKRLRPALLAMAYQAYGGDATALPAVRAGVALELLQVYLLIHDDWMDQSDRRRGGPSAHRMLAEVFGSKTAGESAAVLAGDYAAALAQHVTTTLPLASERMAIAHGVLSRMQCEVVRGQVLDMFGQDRTVESIERVYALKTASYTTKGPLTLGAAMAGASESTLRALDSFGEVLGIAFQVADDMLSAFGSESMTGKPVGQDLRDGKQTLLVAFAAADGDAKRVLEQASRSNLSSVEMALALDALKRTSAYCSLEHRAGGLQESALQQLRELGLDEKHASLFRGAVFALTERTI